MGTTIDTYGAIHARINDAVQLHTGRSVSVTVGRLRSTGAFVLSALASRSDGSLVRVIMTEQGARLDSETGRIADALFAALRALPDADIDAYVTAWADVFLKSVEG
jgi:hypothetical protein